MMKFTTTLILFSIANLTFAQITFQKNYVGNDYEFGYSVRETHDEGFVIAGYTCSFSAGDYDICLIKTDSNGDTLWAKTYGGPEADEAFSVDITNDNGFIITGYTMSFGVDSGDVYLIRTDSTGTILWARTFGGSSFDAGYKVYQTTDKGFIIGGITRSFGAPFNSIYLIKTDSMGHLMWSKIFTQATGNLICSVKQTNDNGYIICATTGPVTTSRDVCLIKTDSNGNVTWSNTYGGLGNDYGNSVFQNSDGGFIVMGVATSFIPYAAIYLIRTDSTGNLIWSNVYQVILDYQYGHCVIQTKDGGFAIGGYSAGFASSSYDYSYLLKTDSTGNILWSKIYGGLTSASMIYAMQQTSDQGYVLVGKKFSYATQGWEVYVVKTDSNGNSNCTENNFSTQKFNASTIVTPIVISVISGGTELSAATNIGNAGFSTSQCQPTDIDERNNNNLMPSIFPNPFTSDISITLQNQNIKHLTFSVKNIFGQTIYSKEESNVSNSLIKSIDLPFLSKGVYLLDINIDGERTVKKIVKQ